MNKNEQLLVITDTLQKGVRNIFTCDEWQNYLKTMSRFHKYSYRNSILIHMQKPDAVYVAGYRAWQKNFHRQVRRGEKGIRILAPLITSKTESEDDTAQSLAGFRSISVFDISQTHGEPLPEFLCSQLHGEVTDYNQMLEHLINISPVPVSFEYLSGGANGFYHDIEKKIVVKDDMPQKQTIKTLIHEIAHACIHSDSEKDRSTKEIEAESIAYAVCSFFHIDTSEYSFRYIAGWSRHQNNDQLMKSISCIQSTADMIISALELNEKEASKPLQTVNHLLLNGRNDQCPDSSVTSDTV